MILKIAAIFTGGAAFAQINHNLTEIKEKAGLAEISFKSLALGAAGLIAGWHGFQEASEFMHESISAATAANAAHESLGITLTRNSKLFKAVGPEGIKDQTEQLEKLAEQMDKAGGISATKLTTAFATMAKVMSPKQIAEFAPAMQGWLVKQGSVNVSVEQTQEITGKLVALMKGGLVRGLAQTGIATREQIKEYGKLKSVTERVAYAKKLLAGLASLTGQAMATEKGRVAQAEKSWEHLHEAIGEPFRKANVAFAVSFGLIAEALVPVAKSLEGILDPLAGRLSIAIAGQTQNIVKFGHACIVGFGYVVENWGKISHGIIAIVGAITLLKTIATVNAAITAFPALLAMIASPVGLTVLAIAALAAAIYFLIENWDKVGPAAAAAWNLIVGIWNNAGSWLAGKFNEVKEATKGIWEPLMKPTQELGTNIGTLLSHAVSGWGDIFNSLGVKLGPIWDSCKTGFNNFINAIGPSVYAGVNKAVEIFEKLVPLVSSKIIAPIIQLFADIVGKLSVGDLSGAFKLWNNACDYIRDTVIKGIIALFTDLIGQINIPDLWIKFSSWVETVAKIHAEVITAIVNAFIALGPEIEKALVGVGAKILAAFSSSIGAVTGLIKGIGDVWNALTFQPKVLPAAPGAATASPLPAPKSAIGGIFHSPQIRTIGEAGSEAVIPLAKMASVMGLGDMKGRKADSKQDIHIEMPINIAGVPMQNAHEVASSVGRVMQSHVNDLLDHLKKARDEEQRLSYA